ncbi:polygalacturonase-1 non-catalytic subunit beta-like [Macadamia integrifolia]|uniref:polygalacturonase-1 non-catalytic subunit beta-like n=1 Tax=Macadamia integrifolia TaxID=60698 RepID=UPI001C52B059|nr:polygalacturonase-1 non-catalytic subunit beta-like [Macadamia integrifolia]
MEENILPSYLPSFCEQANAACSTNALMKKTMDDPNLPPVAKWPNAFKVKYDDLPKEIPLSSAIRGGLSYFRESMIKELKKLFGVVDESDMDEYKLTLRICEKSPTRGEQRSCVISVEDLIDFVVEKLGHHLRIWSTRSIEGSYENATIEALKLIHGNLSEPPAICHSQPFPFQVYYCHVIQKVKVFVVDIYAKKKVNHVIVACHYDTSTWSPDHIAFKLLGFGPGLIEVCHWIIENGMVWTKTLG